VSKKMPMSWFTPGDDVNRSALAVIRAVESVHGAEATCSRPASISRQVAPSLPASAYCRVLTALRTLPSPTAKFWVTQVGSLVDAMSPASMVVPHTSEQLVGSGDAPA